MADLACEGWACQTTDDVLNSGPSVLYIAEINKEVKLVAAGQKKRRGSYDLYLFFTPKEKAPTQ